MMMSDRDMLDLGAASVETKGQTGPNLDEANGIVVGGLSND
jgi:hypothetical protein